MAELNHIIPQPLPVYNQLRELAWFSERYKQQRIKATVHNLVIPADQTRPTKKYLFVPFTIVNATPFTFTSIKLIQVDGPRVEDITQAIDFDSEYATINDMYYFRVFGMSGVSVLGLRDGYYYIELTGTGITKYTEVFRLESLGESANFVEVLDPVNVVNNRVWSMHSSAALNRLFVGRSGVINSFNGTTWTSEGSLPAAPIRSFTDHAGDVYCTCFRSVYRRDGGTWTLVREMPESISSINYYTSIASHDGKLYVGIRNGDLDVLDTGVWSIIDLPETRRIGAMISDINGLFIRQWANVHRITSVQELNLFWGLSVDPEPFPSFAIKGTTLFIGSSATLFSNITAVPFSLPNKTEYNFVAAGNTNFLADIVNHADDIYFVTLPPGGGTKYSLWKYISTGNIELIIDAPEMVQRMASYGGDLYIGGQSSVYKVNL